MLWILDSHKGSVLLKVCFDATATQSSSSFQHRIGHGILYGMLSSHYTRYRLCLARLVGYFQKGFVLPANDLKKRFKSTMI